MHLLQRLFLLLSCSFFLAFNVFAEEPDWKPYAEVLQTVSPGTKHGTQLALVDYPALKDNGKLAAAYQQLSQFPPSRLSSREEKLAFYINAYNILALKMVVDHFPLDSIKDVGSFFNPVWDRPAGTINGKTVSLGEIEHKILRPLGEPRIHLAIVCASVSCPDLRNEPYTAARLDTQLNEQAKKFLLNEHKGLRIDKKQIHISKIFNWFEKDFKKTGGVEHFIRQYQPQLPALSIAADMPYDWSLNGIAQPVNKQVSLTPR